MQTRENRAFETTLQIETRAGDDGADDIQVLRGHAAVFDSLSENLGGFREQIQPGAFDDVLDDDVRALFNHDSNLILGRRQAGTLSLGVDATGLTYEVDLPATRAAEDLAVSVERGDITQSSFAFQVEDDAWDEDDEGRIIRTIKKFKRLFDVSPVTYPAYPDTSVATRCLEQFQAERAAAQAEQGQDPLAGSRRRLDLIEKGIRPPSRA